MIDVVRDSDGALSPSLKDWLESATIERGLDLLARFRVLFDVLQEHDLWLMDLNLQNFLIQTTEDGTDRPWLIDLKRLADNKEIFQIAGWSSTLKRSKLRRRIERFHAYFDVKLRDQG